MYAPRECIKVNLELSPQDTKKIEYAAYEQ